MKTRKKKKTCWLKVSLLYFPQFLCEQMFIWLIELSKGYFLRQEASSSTTPFYDVPGSRWELMYPYGGGKGRGGLWFLCSSWDCSVLSHLSALSLFLVTKCQHLVQLRGVSWLCQCIWMTTIPPCLEKPLLVLSHTTNPLRYGPWIFSNSCLLCHHQPPTSHSYPLSKLEDSLNPLQSMAMRRHWLRPVVDILFTSTFVPISNLLNGVGRSPPINSCFDPMWISLFINFWLYFQTNEKLFHLYLFSINFTYIILTKQNDSGNSGHLTLVLVLQNEIQVRACPKG